MWSIVHLCYCYAQKKKTCQTITNLHVKAVKFVSWENYSFIVTLLQEVSAGQGDCVKSKHQLKELEDICTTLHRSATHVSFNICIKLSLEFE